MSNIIEDFYYGNIEPQELNSEITPKLTGEEKELFLNYVSAYTEFCTMGYADSFISGFRLGARFAYETFVEG